MIIMQKATTFYPGNTTLHCVLVVQNIFKKFDLYVYKITIFGNKINKKDPYLKKNL